MRTSAIRIAGLVLGTAALTGTVAPQAFATGRHPAPPGDYAIGSAVNAFPVPVVGPGTARLSVWAHSRPEGAQPRGTVRATGNGGAPGSGFTVSGPVTCLRVEGNRASIKYKFTQADGSAAALKGGGIEVYLQDHGRSQQTPDAAAFGVPMPRGAFQASRPDRCDDPDLAPYSTVRSGSYTVHDQPR